MRPWSSILIAARVGGVVSEMSFKFFIQFVGWSAIYCVFNLTVAAYFLAEYRREVSEIRFFGPQHGLSQGSDKKPRGKTTPALDSLTNKACFNVYKPKG